MISYNANDDPIILTDMENISKIFIFIERFFTNSSSNTALDH